MAARSGSRTSPAWIRKPSGIADGGLFSGLRTARPPPGLNDLPRPRDADPRAGSGCARVSPPTCPELGRIDLHETPGCGASLCWGDLGPALPTWVTRSRRSSRSRARAPGTGRAAVFCRFSGCNLWSGREPDRATAVCTFCDTDFRGTDGPGGGIYADADQLAERVRAAWTADPAPGARPLLRLHRRRAPAATGRPPDRRPARPRL